MTTADNLLTNYSKIFYTSYFPTDMIIGITSGSFTVAAPTLGNNKTATVTFDTGFGTTCYFQGIFSTDSGATWNDFGSYVPNLTTPGQPVLQTTTCRGYVTSGGIMTMVGLNWFDIVHSSGSQKTILYKVALFAKPDQGNITPIDTSENTYYDSRENSRKVYISGTFDASTTANTTIPHSLGYAPKVSSFFVPTSSTGGNEGLATVPAGALTTLDWFSSSGSGISADVQISTTNAVFTPVQSSTSSPNGIAGTQHYLMFLDA